MAICLTSSLIPSVYCNQFSVDTGIMHKVLSAQTTDGLKFVVKYDSATKMWKPAEEVKQMAIWVTCELVAVHGGNKGNGAFVHLIRIERGSW